MKEGVNLLRRVTALATVLSLCGGAFGQGKGEGARAFETGAVLKVVRVAAPGKGSALKGTVLDPAQGAVPNARVLLVAGGSKRKYTAVTSAAGAFEFNVLPPGAYAVEVSAPGFKTLKMKRLEVGKDETVQLDLALGIGTTAETVAVAVFSGGWGTSLAQS